MYGKHVLPKSASARNATYALRPNGQRMPMANTTITSNHRAMGLQENFETADDMLDFDMHASLYDRRRGVTYEPINESFDMSEGVDLASGLEDRLGYDGETVARLSELVDQMNDLKVRVVDPSSDKETVKLLTQLVENTGRIAQQLLQYNTAITTKIDGIQQSFADFKGDMHQWAAKFQDIMGKDNGSNAQ